MKLEERESASILMVGKPPGLIYMITVPHAVLEWYVDAHDESGAIWSDWADYYPIAGETRAQLEAQMESDLAQFVAVVANAKCRVIVGDTNSIELHIDGVWKRACLDWMCSTTQP